VGVFFRMIRDAIVWYNPVPFWDQVTLVTLSNQWQTGTLPLRTIWRWHNDHLIVFPQLVYLADIIFLQNRNGPLIVFCWLLQLTQAAVFMYFIWRDLQGSYAFLASAWVLAALFLASQIQNFTWGFQVAYLMPHTFATLAVFFLLRGIPQGLRWRQVLLSGACAVVGSFSFASGMLCWPLLWLLSLKLKVRRAYSFFYLIAGIAVWCTILYARKVRDVPKVELHPHFQACWNFLANAMCLTWTFQLSNLSSMLTTLSFAVFVSLAIHFLRQPAPSQCLSFSIFNASFCLSWIMSTALGRSTGDPSFATSSRYQTTVLCYWACLALGLLDWGCRAQWPKLQLALALAFIAAVFASKPTLRKFESDMKYGTNEFRYVESSLKAGVYDPLFLDSNLMFGADTPAQMQISRQKSLSFFSDGLQNLIGTSFAKHFRERGSCAGALTEDVRINSVLPGLRLAGTKAGHDRKVVVVSGDTIVGLGDSFLRPSTQWIAYAQPGNTVEKIYSIDSNSSACFITTAQVK